MEKEVEKTGFRQMRRCRQLLPQGRCVDILERGTSGVLALSGDGGYPYAVPLSYVYAEGRIYFHSAAGGHKIDAVRACPLASFCVIGSDEVVPEEYTTYFSSVIVFGRITIVGDEAERRKALVLLGRRYNSGGSSPDSLDDEIARGMSRTAVLRLDIEHMTGKEAIELVRKRV